ncbi:MAG: hypothetical protein HY695_11725 [Deltaproteobacteria bacterium]|nr:hypothetical protein [Deltaproteobacteria bacterium]
MSVPDRKNATEQELISQGWTKQFFASGSRLQESAKLYESMGFEVLLRPARAADLGCSQCNIEDFRDTDSGFYVIYTRPGKDKEASKPEDDLW